MGVRLLCECVCVCPYVCVCAYVCGSGVSICSWSVRVAFCYARIMGSGDGLGSGVSIRSWNMRAGVSSIEECARRLAALAFIPGICDWSSFIQAWGVGVCFWNARVGVF